MFKLIVLFFGLSVTAHAQEASIADEMEKIETILKVSELYGKDQGIRRAWFYLHGKGFASADIAKSSELKERQLEIDKANVAALKVIIEKNGWLNSADFTKQTDTQAWIIVQHADHDPEFQETVLRLLRQSVADKKSIPQNFAYLFDRVYHRKGKKQVYGTQGACKGKGEWLPHPLREPEKIDEFRSSVELGSMKDYKKRMNASCR
ncbi:hypothetical protein N9D31_03525 [Oligoflexaceae bacterium]|nr:hypothetical protein [Oligoflexaceae bacterium]